MVHTLDYSKRCATFLERSKFLDPAKEGWMDRAKRILIAVQLRDKLEKFLTVLSETGEGIGSEVIQTITLKPFNDSREALALVSMLSYSSRC